MPEMAKLVVVAAVPVALVKVKVVRVEEAVERNPFSKARVVEVACSLVESLVKGQGSPAAVEGHTVRQSPARQIVSEAKAVEVALVVVLLVAVKVVRVEDEFETKPLPKFMVVEVDCSPVPKVRKG